MKTVAGILALLMTTLVMSAPTSAFGGTPIDPNVGDHVFGTIGGVRYASDASPFVSQSAGAEAGCGGPNWHLIGGGSAAGGSVAQAWLAASRWDDFNDTDTAGDDGWLAYGRGPDGAAVTAYSICVHGGTLAYPFTNLPDSSSGERSGSLSCGAPRWHVSTGSVFIATTGSWVTSSFPLDGADPKTVPDDGWTGSVYDVNGGTGGFGVYIVCAAQMPLRYVKLKPGRLVADGTILRRVACGPAEHVVGGGARVTGGTSTARSIVSAPYDGTDADHIPDDGWVSRIHSLGGGARRVTPFAICLG